MPVIRNKVVLNILDGVKGVYHGGPGARPEFVWEHHTMYFATDPVALDHVGWTKIDEKRLAVGKKKLVEDTPTSTAPTSTANPSTSRSPALWGSVYGSGTESNINRSNSAEPRL